MNLSHNEFQEFRFCGLGGSDAAALMGVHPWKTEYSLWEEKVFRIEKTKSNAAMEHGKRMEEPTRKKLEEKYNVALFPQSWIDKENAWFRGNVDGVAIDGSLMVEIKNPSSKAIHLQVKNDKVIPEYYFPQCQWYLGLAETQGYDFETILYASHFSDDLFDLQIAKDPAYISELAERGEAFWDKVLNFEPPEMTDRDKMAIAKAGKTKAERLSEVIRLLDELEDEKDKLKGDLIDLSDGKSCAGFGISLTKYAEKGRIDWAKWQKDHPEHDYDAYRKPHLTKWRLSRIA